MNVPEGVAYCPRTNEFFILLSGVRKNDAFYDYWSAYKHLFPQVDKPKIY